MERKTDGDGQKGKIRGQRKKYKMFHETRGNNSVTLAVARHVHYLEAESRRNQSESAFIPRTVP